MARKAPKAYSYSTTDSADYRYACAVGQKNEGEDYIKQVVEKISLSPGTHLKKHVNRVTHTSRVKAKVAKTIVFKARQRLLQKARTQLRNRKEQSEGVTYESNMNLLQTEKRDSDTVKTTEMSILTLADPFSTESKCIVIFDLETSGFEINCDVLQVACKCGSVVFNDYIRPTKCISPKAKKKMG